MPRVAASHPSAGRGGRGLGALPGQHRGLSKMSLGRAAADAAGPTTCPRAAMVVPSDASGTRLTKGSARTGSADKGADGGRTQPGDLACMNALSRTLRAS